MSDQSDQQPEQDPHEFDHHPIFYGEPEEVKQQVAEFKARHRSIEIDIRHSISRFLDSLDLEGVKSLRHILGSTLSSEQAASFYMGMAETLLSHKFKVCTACGVSHDAELEKLLSRPDSTPPPVDESDVSMAMEYAQQLETYRLEEFTPEDAVESQLRCRDCQMVYVSLMDRMVKAPDDCEGCRHKAKWG